MTNVWKNKEFIVAQNFTKPTKLLLQALSQSKIGLEIETVIFRF